MFGGLGTEVTIATALDRLAPFDEPEASAAIEDALEADGITIATGAEVVSVRPDATGRSVTMRTAVGRERERAYGEILVAADRRPVTGGLDLDAAGVTAGARGEIVTDRFQRTTNPRVWAAGDATQAFGRDVSKLSCSAA